MAEKHSDEIRVPDDISELRPDCGLGNGVVYLDFGRDENREIRVVCTGGWRSEPIQSLLRLGTEAMVHSKIYGCQMRWHESR